MENKPCRHDNDEIEEFFRILALENAPDHETCGICLTARVKELESEIEGQRFRAHDLEVSLQVAREELDEERGESPCRS